MPQSRDIRVRVTKDQLDRIKLNAQAKGFKSISSYMRYLCLEYNQHVESKIIETNKILKQMNKTEPVKDKNNINHILDDINP